MNKILRISLIIAGVLLVLTTLILANRHYNNVEFSSFKIEIINNNDSTSIVVDTNYIYNYLDSNYRLEGTKIKDINLHNIEQDLSKNYHVSQLDVVISNNGVIKLKITPRIVICRSFVNGKEYFIDNKGELIPPYITNHSLPIVFIENDSLKETHNDFYNILSPLLETPNYSYIDSITTLFTYLNSSEKYLAFIDQIIFENNNIYCFSILSNHKIYLGNVSNLSSKFSNLFEFYKQESFMYSQEFADSADIEENIDIWNQYQVIDLRFKDRVICK